MVQLFSRSKAQFFCGVLTILIAAVCLFGWYTNNLSYASFNTQFIMMAPSTGICFCMLGLALLIFGFDKHFAGQISLLRILIFIPSAICIFELFVLIAGFDSGIDRFLSGTTDRLGSIPIGRMSPITALLFLFSCSGLYMMIIKPGFCAKSSFNCTAILSMPVLFTSFVIVIGYCYSVPFFYNGTFVPPALPTAVCFFIISAGTVYTVGKNASLLSAFFGDTVFARLVRNMVPMIVIMVLLEGWTDTIKISLISNQAVTHLLFTFVMIGILIVIVASVSRNVSRQLLTAEAETKASNERFKSYIQSAPDGVFIANEKGQYLEVNPAACKMTGYTQNELLSLSISEIIAKESFQAAIEHFQKVVNEGFASGELTIVTKSGEERFWNVEAVKLSQNRFLGFAKDITDRVRAEEIIRKNDIQFRKLSANVPDLIFQFTRKPDGSYCVPIASEGIKRIFGCSPEDVVGDFTPIARVIYPEDVERVVTEIEYSAQHLTYFSCEFRVQIPGKPIQWIFSRSAPEKLPDGSITWYGFNADITERKLAEEALQERDELFRTVTALAPVGIYLTGPDGNCRYANPAWCKMAGLKLEEALGNGWINGLHPEDRELVFSNWNKMVESQGQWGHEYRFLDRDGKITWVYGLATPQYDTSGKIVSYVGVNQDITERKLLEEEHMKAEQQRNQMQKLESLGILAGGIAHDFNNLLGGIFGYIDMAAEGTAEHKTASQLSKALNTIDRARALTQQLLTFAKGGAPVQKVQSLFPFVKENALFALSGSNVSCQFKVDDAIWDCNFDKNQIGQVIDNIVINAQQAMPSGGTLEISAKNISLDEKEYTLLAKGNYVKLTVKDSGIGIPEQIITRIFDPFFTTKPKGHGLGLATCYSIINRHGGCIDVESEPGMGSTFTIYLPAVNEKTEIENEVITHSHKGSGTFLVMDDEDVMQDTIGAMLESIGYTTVCRGNGKDAFDYFKENRQMAGIILDLTVPGGIGGKDVVEEIRKLDKDLPVFVASGYAEDPIMRNPQEYGFTASISKPFRKAELLQMLNKYINV